MRISLANLGIISARYIYFNIHTLIPLSDPLLIVHSFLVIYLPILSSESESEESSELEVELLRSGGRIIKKKSNRGRHSGQPERPIEQRRSARISPREAKQLQQSLNNSGIISSNNNNTNNSTNSSPIAIPTPNSNSNIPSTSVSSSTSSSPIHSNLNSRPNSERNNNLLSIDTPTNQTENGTTSSESKSANSSGEKKDPKLIAGWILNDSFGQRIDGYFFPFPNPISSIFDQQFIQVPPSGGLK